MQLKKITAALLIALPGLALASGFQTWVQSGSAAGDYASGAAADTSNVDVAFYNPAAMGYVTKGQLAGFSIINGFNSVKFKGSTSLSPAVSNFTSNSGSVQGGQYSFLPSIMYIAPISKKWAFGLALTSPFKMNVNYGNAPFTRYAVTKSYFNSYEINPSLSYRPMNKLSFGLGFDALYGKQAFNYVDTLTSTANDSFVRSKLSGWGFGWNAGMFWQATKTTNVGISYRSGIHFRGSGMSRYSGPLGDNSVRVKNSDNLPALTIFSITQKINKKLTLLGTAAFTNWAALGSLRLKSTATDSGSTNLHLAHHLHNSWRFILGAHYQYTPKIMLKGALGYVQSAVDSKTNQMLSFPMYNQYVVALGVGYHINKKFAASLGFTHFFDAKSSVNHSQAMANETVTNTGNLYGDSSLIGVEFDWTMTN
jgi:long-chain fatty acid transport protein